jgi:hypothetical protein
MQALSALTPPLVVCAVVIIAIVAFLRHEMARSRAGRSAPGDETELPGVLSSPDTDNNQNDLTEESRAPADDSGPVPRRLR